MAKNNKKTKARAEDHPTMFVLEGAIKVFKDGSMVALNTQITAEEWELIIEDTVKYKVFLECLKETACPILEEEWTEEDDYFRHQLDIAVSRMRNIDPLLVSRHDQKKITKVYTEKMEKNAQEVSILVAKTREEQKAVYQKRYNMNGDEDVTAVSNL